MNRINMARFSILGLWMAAFVAAFLLHLGLGISLYLQSISVGMSVLQPAIMLTFANERIDTTAHAVLDHDLDKDSGELPSKLLESKQSEEEIHSKEPQAIEKKGAFIEQRFLRRVPPRKVKRKEISKKELSMSGKRDTKKMRSSVADKEGSIGAFGSVLSSQWLEKVRERLEVQKNYIIRHRIGYEKGTVQLEFRVNGHGEIFSNRIRYSSGDQELDLLAMTALKRVGLLPPPPRSEVEKIIRISLIFR